METAELPTVSVADQIEESSAAVATAAVTSLVSVSWWLLSSVKLTLTLTAFPSSSATRV